jgi:hypothetical protein
MDVAHDADDRPPMLIAEFQAFSHRILIGPELARHRFVDHHDESAVLVVSSFERAATLDGDTDSFEIAGSDGPVIGGIVNAGRVRRPAFDKERPIIVCAGERQMRSEADKLYPRDGTYAVGKFALEYGNLAMLAGSELIAIGVSRRKGKTSCEDVRGLEPGRHPQESAQAFDHQARAGQENQSERDLPDNERAAQTGLSGRNAAGVQPDARRLDHRNQPEHNSERAEWDNRPT